MPDNEPRKPLSIRLDDELREQLQLVADREMRPLGNQIMFFCATALRQYLDENHLYYDAESGQLKFYNY